MNESSAGASGKKPLAVFAVVERDNRSFWIRVGSAFNNRDGSINLYLEAFPIGSNRLQVREQRLEERNGASANGHAPAASSAEVQP